MTIYISSSVVLTDSGANANSPVIGYENRVTINNITSTTEDGDFPVTNLANPSTTSLWKSTSTATDEYVTVVVNSVEQVDYVGIAAHNFGSAVVTVSIEVQATDGGSWVEVNAETVPGDDRALIFRFVPQSVYAVRVRLQPTGTEPQAAVLYVGKLLLLQRNIYVGHTPITYGRINKVVTGRSENGNFLGRIVLNEKLETSVSMQNITPSWYRNNLDPFIIDSKENPFFWSWRPDTYPLETGYAVITDNPQPVNQLGNGMMQIDFSMAGVSL